VAAPLGKSLSGMSITAVVVNYNAGQALQACVQSLINSTVLVDIKVVDNASTDHSAQQLRHHYGHYPRLEVLFNPGNYGFARAVNETVRNLDSDLVLVINPDCELDRDALAHLQHALETDVQAALAAPLVIDSKGKIEKACVRRFPDPWSSLVTLGGLWRLGRWIPWLKGISMPSGSIPAAVSTVDAVSGACMLIRRRAMLDIGLMDEEYGMHCEDLDLMFRFKAGGWHCLFVPEARAVHLQGVSSRSRPLWVHRQKHLGMARFFRKFQAPHYSVPVSWLVYGGIWLRYALLWPWVWIKR